MSRRLLNLGLLLSAALVLVSCGSAPSQPSKSSTPAASSGIYGIGIRDMAFSSARMLPTELPGGFGKSEWPPRPFSAFVVKAASGPRAGEVVARVTSGADGTFKITLPPGKYVVTPEEHRYDSCKAVVEPGEYRRISLLAGS